MLGLLALGLWLVFGVYSFWFLFQAETFQPLTLDDLALTWKVHKQEAGCNALRIHSLIVKDDKVVGFKCDCGFKFLQKRLITQSVCARTDILSLGSSEGANMLCRSEGSLQWLNLDHSCIEKA
jgi:hypothetical protein